jgi:hypothetical protein
MTYVRGVQRSRHGVGFTLDKQAYLFTLTQVDGMT